MNGKAQRLGWCNNCKEHSLIRRSYMRVNDNRMERLEFCINKSCGYKLALPFRNLTLAERAE